MTFIFMTRDTLPRMADPKSGTNDALESLLLSIAVPLITLDNAELYVVRSGAEAVHLHLGGNYAGCPGNRFVERALLAPLVRDVYPHAVVTVTSGLPVPEGAKQLAPPPP